MIEVHEFRREELVSAEPAADTNAGLWLDKYLRSDSDEAKKNLVKEITQTIKIPKAYDDFYKNWQRILAQQGIVPKTAKSLARLAVNLGAEAVLENSIALNRTYGVPYIPGSALKGLASHYAMTSLGEEWKKDSPAFKVVFGGSEEAGYVNFLDALYIPGSGRALVPDVITVHHQDYYQNGKTPPADWDSPIPIPFISISGSFLLAVSGPPDWVEAAYKILAHALRNEGIGAKTSSGYGRMEIEGLELEDEPSAEGKSSQPTEIPSGYQRGVVKTVKETFGFIQPDAGGKDIFVHFSNLSAGLKELRPRQHVIFKTEPGKKPGELRAVDVRLAE